jgi:predicted PhzF superfamily epimerase YddE/YHI9
LNFRVFGGFSPLRIFSAPNDLPFAGHPYLGPNTLFHTLQELPEKTIKRQIMKTSILREAIIRINSAITT